MEKGARINLALALLSLLIGILFIALVLAVPQWIVDPPSSSSNASQGTEDINPSISYNISANVTNTTANENFTFEFSTTEGNPNSISSSIHGSQQSNSFYYWISLNSSTGILRINSTRDNETGQFNITIDVKNQNNLGAGARVFYFIVNATNDFPVFTNIQQAYNLTENQTFIDYLNATDEEQHYPLYFEINFTNCTHATWSSRNNCSLFVLANLTNTSAIMNFTPVHNDVGVYQANISVRDFGANYTCNSTHCASGYSQNKTTYYSQLVNFSVFAILAINATDCQNKIFQENQSSTCQINITTHGSSDSLNISSLALVRNYAGNVSNSSWFFAPNLTVSATFTKTININVTPQKTEIGNWTINFTVRDLTYSENVTEQIYVYVNRTLNSIPNITDVTAKTTSKNASTRINLTVYDDDLLIPDKLEGYNETINFTIKIYNRSDLTQELTLSNFTVQILYMPVSGTNRTEAKIEFTPIESDVGNYTINITIKDKQNATDFTLFNLTIINNSAPQWNSTLPAIVTVLDYENNRTYLNLSKNVSDPDNDVLTFSYTNDSSFPSFNLSSSTGVVNFTTSDVDVGYHNITITASDSYLTATKGFNFTVLNINDNPQVQTLDSIVNATGDSTVGINTSEDNRVTLNLYVEDRDLDIPLSQRAFYNENFTINLTIQGPNTRLFNFSQSPSFPDDDSPNYYRLSYQTIFTPNKTDIGTYNITINATDASNRSSILMFNLTIFETQHSPNMTFVGNQVFSILNETFYINVNATDLEDVNETFPGSNLTYTLKNLTSGGNFLTINRTTGIINFTFNQTYAGHWTYNLSVNDSAGLVDWEIFNVTVYDYPSINYPPIVFSFNFVENISSRMNFSTNHTVGVILNDTLNYSLYINNILRNSTLGYGNGTQFIWNFTSGFTDETCSSVSNLTLNVSNVKLSTARTWNLTVNHTNQPLQLATNIPDQSAASPITITLSSYFSDADVSSSCSADQTAGFNYTLVNGSSAITVSITNWTNATTPTIVFSSSSSATAIYKVTGTEYNSSGSIIGTAQSNNFTVNITSSTTTVTVTTSGGGGGSSATKTMEKISLKIIVPEPVRAKKKDSFSTIIGFFNDGAVKLENITLNTAVLKDSVPKTDMVARLEKKNLPALSVEEYQNSTLYVDVDTKETGTFEILISASSKNPSHLEWESFYVEVEEEDIEEKIIFTEEFIIGNPQCTELKEIVDEAWELFNKGDTNGALLKTNEALEACKRAIAQEPRSRIIDRFGDKLFGYLGIASLSAFALGFIYYFYRRVKLKRQLSGY